MRQMPTTVYGMFISGRGAVIHVTVAGIVIFTNLYIASWPKKLREGWVRSTYLDSRCAVAKYFGCREKTSVAAVLMWCVHVRTYTLCNQIKCLELEIMCLRKWRHNSSHSSSPCICLYVAFLCLPLIVVSARHVLNKDVNFCSLCGEKRWTAVDGICHTWDCSRTSGQPCWLARLRLPAKC
jgi:hypothetical protein